MVVFEDLPSTNTPINADNLNENFGAVNNIGTIIYSGDISSTGNYNFTSSGANYRFLIIELSTATSSVRSFVIVPAPKIMTDTSMYISFNAGDTTIVWARIVIYNAYIQVLDMSSNAHIRSIRGIL